MVEFIEKMLVCGVVYVIDWEMGEYQDIYFCVDVILQFGYELGYDCDIMLWLCEECGGDLWCFGKSDEFDVLLWWVVWFGEFSWLFLFGFGWLGWYVECVVIVFSCIGSGFDIQGGGSDLIFLYYEFIVVYVECVSGEW